MSKFSPYCAAIEGMSGTLEIESGLTIVDFVDSDVPQQEQAQRFQSDGVKTAVA
jgi:hypothetical protein